jgi:hypothetical protein
MDFFRQVSCASLHAEPSAVAIWEDVLDVPEGSQLLGIDRWKIMPLVMATSAAAVP